MAISKKEFFNLAIPAYILVWFYGKEISVILTRLDTEADKKMANFFVTGATGFIGSFVAAQLIELGHTVFALVRETSNRRWIKDLPLEIVTGSLDKPESYTDILKKCEYIVHLAGTTKAFDPKDYYRGNVNATRFLLDQIVLENPNIKKFVQVSSQAAVGPSPNSDLIDESVPMNPVTDYGKSKRDCEELVWKYIEKLPITIIRPPSVYGPRDTDVYNAFKTIKSGLNLQVGTIDQLVSIVYVEDLARGIIDAALSEKTTGKTYFLCEEKPYRWSEVAKIIGRKMNKKFITIKIPYFFAWIISSFLEIIAKLQKKTTILNRQKMIEVKQHFWTLDSTRAKKDFSYKTRFPLENGIERTVDWYRANGWL